MVYAHASTKEQDSLEVSISGRSGQHQLLASLHKDSLNHSASPLLSVKHPDSLLVYRHIPLNKSKSLSSKLFGKGGIRWLGSGTVGIRSGWRRTRVHNPILSKENQSHTSINFQENVLIQSSLQIGTKVDMMLNYGSESSFSDSKRVKIDYRGEPHEIIKHIEAGQVSLTSTNSLIRGGGALWGIKSTLQWGKARANIIAAQQQTQKRTVTAQVRGQSQSIRISAADYEANQHFFLGHHFVSSYENAIKSLPNINSNIYIRRAEVWVTNRTNDYSSARNIIAFTDMGESQQLTNSNWQKTPLSAQFPSNDSNSLYSTLLNQYAQIRDIHVATQALSSIMEAGKEYEKIEMARKLNETEYTIHPKLGYISIHTPIQSDDVIAIAYEYTVDGQLFQVGEFASDSYNESASSSVNNTPTLWLKLLKPVAINPQSPLWSGMMKNVYNLQYTNIQTQRSRVDITYQNSELNSYTPYLPNTDKTREGLIVSLLGFDKLNANQSYYPDGAFDLVDEYTIDPIRGRLFLPALKPFGSHLYEVLPSSMAQAFAFDELYNSSQTAAKQLFDKNKFFIEGVIAGGSSTTIQLHSQQIVPRSVEVRIGSTSLMEGRDFMVDYVNGTVTISNSTATNNENTIIVEFREENGASKGRKTLLGGELIYDINRNLSVGGSLFYLNEKNYADDILYGSEPAQNSLVGAHINYQAPSGFLTKQLQRATNTAITDSVVVSFTGEVASLQSHINDQTRYVYLENFENNQQTVSLTAPHKWKLSSTPHDPSPNALFPEASLVNNVEYGKNRALLSWFVIDRLFSQPNNILMPKHLQNNREALSNHFVRPIHEHEIYPNRQRSFAQETNINPLNISFYPSQRGPYNLNYQEIKANGELSSPENRWGGIMQSLEVTNFEEANIGAIKFWLLDPFVYDKDKPSNSPIGGDLYINIGDISEDVLKDGRKAFEGYASSTWADTTVWGKVPRLSSTVLAFDTSLGEGAVQKQDVGLNGLSSLEEQSFGAYATYVEQLKTRLSPTTLSRMQTDPLSPLNNPAGDNFHSFLGSDFDLEERSILDRYKHINGTEGNSSGEQQLLATTTPDSEDINGDNSLNEHEAYYQYKIELRPEKMVVGENFITEARKVVVDLPNGSSEEVTWYQFHIPITDYHKRIGDIQDFQSIRFIRLFLTNFYKETFLRFASLELVNNQWRVYENGASSEKNLHISTVSIEENASQSPVNYVMPPYRERQRTSSTTQSIEENEQAISLSINDLKPNDEVGIYRTMFADLRNYSHLELLSHIHAIGENSSTLHAGDISLFIRIGSDLNHHFYQYELPLEPTPHGFFNNYSSADRLTVWPLNNHLSIDLERLIQEKIELLSGTNTNQVRNSSSPFTVVGNPSLGNIRVVMIGIKNNSSHNQSVQVWANDLRLRTSNNQNGWATRGELNLSLASVGNINISAIKETSGFGALEQNIHQRRQDNLEAFAFDLKIDIGKFTPKAWNLSAPVFYHFDQSITTPKYSIQHTDLPLHLWAKSDSAIKENQFINTTKSFSIQNLKAHIQSKTPMPYDLANFAFSFSSHQTTKSSYTIQYNTVREKNIHINYSYSPPSKTWKPFAQRNNALRNIALQYLPRNISLSSHLHHYYTDNSIRTIDNADNMVSWLNSFFWNRNLSFQWDLTPNIRIDYKSFTKTEIEAPYLQANKKENPHDYKAWRKASIKSILRGGKPIEHGQSSNIHWQIPLYFIENLKWMNASIHYQSLYKWQLGRTNSDSTASAKWGNSINNSRNITFQGQLDFARLWNQSDVFKKANQRIVMRPTSSNQQLRWQQWATLCPDSFVLVQLPIPTTQNSIRILKENTPIPFRLINPQTVEILHQDNSPVLIMVYQNNGRERNRRIPLWTRLIVPFRSISVNYTTQRTSFITGFAPHIGQFLGQTNHHSTPGWRYALGMETGSKLYSKALKRGWLVPPHENLNPMLFSFSKQLLIRSQIEPVRGLKIELYAQHSHSHNKQVFHLSAKESFSGSFSVSTIGLKRSPFRVPNRDGYNSNVFDAFLRNRVEVSTTLNNIYSQKKGSQQLSDLSVNSPDVLLPAFWSAYTQQRVSSSTLTPIPSIGSMLPNWNVSYNVLELLPSLQNHFINLRLSHRYSANYQVGAYNSYTGWKQLVGERGYIPNPITGTLTPSSAYDISTAIVSERFSPLIGIEASTKEQLTISVQYNATQNTTLSTSALQIAEWIQHEWAVGFAHKTSALGQHLHLPWRVPKGHNDELSLRIDFSFIHSHTLLRRIESAFSQATNVLKTSSWQCSIDYSPRPSITLGIYATHLTNNPIVSPSTFKTSITEVGLNLNLSLWK